MTIIIFEGTDKTGKSTSAAKISSSGEALYNMNVHTYEEVKSSLKENEDLVFCFDRLDWFTHMVYRLAMPDYEWNDDRVRRVFTAPDAHLVIKAPKAESLPTLKDELYESGALAAVSLTYAMFAKILIQMNTALGQSLFKSISLIEVDTENDYKYKMIEFASITMDLSDAESVVDDESLLQLLQKVDHEEDQMVGNPLTGLLGLFKMLNGFANG